MTQACSEMVMTYQFRCYRWGSLIIIGCCSVELVCYATLQIVDTGLSLIFEIIELFLEGTLMLLDKWKNMVVVHPGGTICAWMEQEYEGTQFQEVVEWNELKDYSCELIDNCEDTEANPVGKPLLVVILSIGLKSNKAFEAWVGNSNNLSDVGLTDPEHNQDHSDTKTVGHDLLWLESGDGTDL